MPSRAEAGLRAVAFVTAGGFLVGLMLFAGRKRGGAFHAERIDVRTTFRMHGETGSDVNPVPRLGDLPICERDR